MRTFKLWLINDPDIPGFKKLAWDIVEVEIRDVLEQGIHPWGDRDTCRTLMERFIHVLNDDRFNIPELADLGYCDAFASHTHHYCGEQNQFEELLSRINQSVRFVGSLNYRQLHDLAKKQLRQNWNHRLVRQLIGRIYYNFNDLRGFIKSVNNGVKLRSYDDLNSYDLAQVLKLEDFETEDSILISEGLPVTNFRPESWLTEVTNSDGLLKLAESIDDFELYPPNSPTGYGNSRLIYHGCRRKDEIRLTPTLNNNPAVRTEARHLARRWRTDDGTFSFTTDISKLTEMLTDSDMQIRFPRLDYVRKRDPAVSTAQLNGSALTQYSIGRFATARCSGDMIKGILRRYLVPMTGTKEVLLEKLSKLACQQYRKHEREMGSFFLQNRCIKVGGNSGCKPERFPVLEELELRNLLLTMFALKHLRGNAILDATYENDTFDLIALAQSLVNEEVSLSGCFLRVED